MFEDTEIERQKVREQGQAALNPGQSRVKCI